MRLLNIKTRKLEEFVGVRTPAYAILSHTWGKEEVTFQDLQHPSHKDKHEYAKIEGACQLAARDNLQWLWMDTCCIDKSSSAELSEGNQSPSTYNNLSVAHKTAINSMFNWYRDSTICYIFLEDVAPSNSTKDLIEAFRKSRWLTRGWTLQEYLAPSRIELYSSSWTRIYDPSPIGIKRKIRGFSEAMLLLHCTGIDRQHWRAADIPAILSWAAKRQTTREEDMAYCLLGLLDVKMPLLYGEGSAAFPRLIEEVIKKSNSHGVLAAGYNMPWTTSPLKHAYLLPKSPWPYGRCTKGFKETPVPGRSYYPHFSLTNAGLSIELPLVMIDGLSEVVLGLLNCQDRSKPLSQVAIVLIRIRDVEYSQFYFRAANPLSVPFEFHRYARRENIYITNVRLPDCERECRVDCVDLQGLGYDFGGVYPPCAIQGSTKGCKIFVPNNLKDNTLVLLFTVTGNLPNLVVLIPQIFPPSRATPLVPLVSLTDAASLIEFLLRPEDVKYNQEPIASLMVQQSYYPESKALSSSLTWSNQVDLGELKRRSCWSHAVDICVPESPNILGKKCRLSARLHTAVPRLNGLVISAFDLTAQSSPLSRPR